MKAKKLSDMSEIEILERLARIENRYPPRMADIKFLVNLARELLSEITPRLENLKT